MIATQGPRLSTWNPKGCQFLPALELRLSKPCGIGSFSLIHAGLDDELIGFADLPVVPPHTLSARAFATEPFDANSFSLIEHFYPIFDFNGVGIVAFRRIPDRKEHDLIFSRAELLNSEVAGI